MIKIKMIKANNKLLQETSFSVETHLSILEPIIIVNTDENPTNEIFFISSETVSRNLNVEVDNKSRRNLTKI